MDTGTCPNLQNRKRHQTNYVKAMQYCQLNINLLPAIEIVAPRTLYMIWANVIEFFNNTPNAYTTEGTVINRIGHICPKSVVILEDVNTSRWSTQMFRVYSSTLEEYALKILDVSQHLLGSSYFIGQYH